jgi:hypothetical protein
MKKPLFSCLVCRAIGPIALLVLTGCVSTKYKMAPKDAAPPVMLNLSATSPATASVAVDAAVNTVIVYQGPGSWKRAAYWDEYIVSVVNRTGTPITVEAATLVDFQGATTEPGGKPWELEKQSQAYTKQKPSTTRNVVKVGAGAVATTVGSAAVSGGIAYATAAGWAGVAGISAGIAAAAVALPAYGLTTVYLNSSRRGEIEKEFARRRLSLPAAVPAGETVRGSWFFRISPGPQRLTLRCRVDGELRDLVVDLAPLAHLHLEAAPAK